MAFEVSKRQNQIAILFNAVLYDITLSVRYQTFGIRKFFVEIACRDAEIFSSKGRQAVKYSVVTG